MSETTQHAFHGQVDKRRMCAGRSSRSACAASFAARDSSLFKTNRPEACYTVDQLVIADRASSGNARQFAFLTNVEYNIRAYP